MKEIFCLLIALAVVLAVVLLMFGVQNAKKKGEYLQLDDPTDYGQPGYYENETVCPEEEDAA